MREQSRWQFVANLGDANPITYGGAFIYQDTLGEETPMLEILEEPQEDSERPRWTLYRICLDQEVKSWVKLGEVASCMDTTEEELRSALLGDDVIARAQAYLDLVGYHGASNFDSYPCHLTLAEVKARYHRERKRNWQAKGEKSHE
jgi:hypothetical protein